jgi:hypothetical protein
MKSRESGVSNGSWKDDPKNNGDTKDMRQTKILYIIQCLFSHRHYASLPNLSHILWLNSPGKLSKFPLSRGLNFMAQLRTFPWNYESTTVSTVNTTLSTHCDIPAAHFITQSDLKFELSPYKFGNHHTTTGCTPTPTLISAHKLIADSYKLRQCCKWVRARAQFFDPSAITWNNTHWSGNNMVGRRNIALPPYC